MPGKFKRTYGKEGTKKISPNKTVIVDNIWMFSKIGVGPQNGWFLMENLIEMDDLGGKTHYFRKHPFTV